MSPSLRPAHVRLPKAELSRIEDLRAAPRNARTHSKKQLRQISASITAFGFTNPVLVDASGEVIAGHGRLAAARMLGLTDVPTLCLDWLSDEQKRAYVIADNRLAEKAGWDRDLLAIELGELVSLDFDVTLTGFEMREIELIIDAGGPNPEDVTEEQAEGPPVCQPGDLWQLGHHRLLCGDALDAQCYRRLMERDKARLIVTDPPYNVKISGHVSGLGRKQHREFVQGSGELTSTAFTQFLRSSLSAMAEFSRDGSLHYVFMDWRHLPELMDAGQAVYDDWLNLCVWAKSNAGMGSFYRSQHEMVAVYKKGKRQHVNNIELGANGRHRSNVWNYAGVNTFKAGREEELGWHPTVKPLDLISDIIRDASDPGEIVLDGFGGSGTTLIAAAHCGRVARVLELDPLYCDVILRRYSATFGELPIHVASGQNLLERAQELGVGGGND
jgi:DNA modification methylase